ncbi:molybdenum cofactor guanylyltransferase [Novimethylophilus kurashikiensis]|uniref:Molybdenum cofactor guanylyltransferase n=1 Tax=Novimethylophilus kurashikiensis TaxID=1825523 RepID=A0A2R5FCK4_9PROT|nr:hypothetical protein [Novimethylophilus kurashikiensis]GBG14441.1 molybdenum cofactor guanylyltransferase [Novimethylophilus kurashikiensis]
MQPTMIQEWMRQQLAKVEGNCHSAQGRIAAARTMREVVQAMQISVPPELRSVIRSQPGMRALTAAAERRLTELLEAQLEEARKAESTEAAKGILGRRRAQDWPYLRGTYAHIYRKADMEARRLLHTKEKESGNGH